MTADTQFLEWCLKCLWIRVREHAEFEFFSDWNIAAYDEWLCVVCRKYIGQGEAVRHPALAVTRRVAGACAMCI